MKTKTNINTKNQLSAVRVRRLRAQGYNWQSEAELNELAFGHRLTFRLCLGVLSIAIITANIYLLAGMVAIAFLSIVLPYHIFDYFYNEFVRKWIGGSRLPRRSKQLKFACILATPWIGSIIYFFQAGQPIPAYTLGTLLMITAFLVGFFDLCIPSMVYNALFIKKVNRIQANW